MCALCWNCIKDILPFSFVSNTELHDLAFNSKEPCLCSFITIKVRPCGSADMAPAVCENYLPHTTSTTTQKLLNCSNNSLSTIHCNIRSLNANFYSLNLMLTELQHILILLVFLNQIQVLI